MSRPVPYCHRTISMGQWARTPNSYATDNRLETVGTPCIGSKCAAWCGARDNNKANQPLTGLGCCRDFYTSVYHTDDLWEDPACPDPAPKS